MQAFDQSVLNRAIFRTFVSHVHTSTVAIFPVGISEKQRIDVYGFIFQCRTLASPIRIATIAFTITGAVGAVLTTTPDTESAWRVLITLHSIPIVTTTNGFLTNAQVPTYDVIMMRDCDVTSFAACQCNGHSNCSFAEPEVCAPCEEGTTGTTCDHCDTFYYGDAINGGQCSRK